MKILSLVLKSYLDLTRLYCELLEITQKAKLYLHEVYLRLWWGALVENVLAQNV